MNSVEFLIYVFYFVLLLSLSYWLDKRYRLSALGVIPFLILYISTIVLSSYSAHRAESDTIRYIEDAKLLITFIQSDFKLLGLFFLSGGNSIYPNSYYPMLISSNTWSNYSSFAIEKFYLLFSLLSKPNLFIVSIFFGFLAFCSKLLLLRLARIYGIAKNNYLILCIFLCFGMTDVYFVSGVYKECIFLFLISVLLNYYHSRKTIWRNIFAFLCIVQIIFLRFDIAMLIALAIVSIKAYHHFKLSLWTSKISYGILLFTIFIWLRFSPINTYLTTRLNRFSTKFYGNTGLGEIDWSEDLWSLLKILCFRWIGFFYTSIAELNSLFILIDFYNIFLLLVVVYLLINNFYWDNFLKNTINLILIVFSFIISISIPNFGTQLRYRAPFIVLFIAINLLNINIKKKYI